MDQIYRNGTILMVDDDPDDFFLARDALRETGIPNDFELVADGEELMDYLYRRGKFLSLQNSPLPILILLDLNMPRKDGREALAEVKKDPDFCGIPIVVFTTSKEDKDISYCYDLGASLYITKPATFDALVEVMKKLGEYWLELVNLPEQRPEKSRRLRMSSQEYSN
jgi:CheY-like chemotaxis protein